MKIPFAGEVCPYCLRNKKGDQTRTVATGVGLIIGGLSGHLVDGITGMIVGGLAFGLLAAIIGPPGKNHTG